MNNDYRVYRYNSYVKRVIAICVLPWIVPVLNILLAYERFYTSTIVFSVVFSIVGFLMLTFSRRAFLVNLTTFELNFDLVYELDKRNEKTNFTI